MPNRLAKETSPYLRQHAQNPVDWYPWGEEALAEAKRTGKPILLSVGYSACHWCHVMAHESFEDESIAKVMNDLFVNVKVDREERPDIDQIYQTAQAMLTQRSGGWPLTMFLTPEQVPFFGGTYFPSQPRYGMPAFPDLIRRVREFYDAHPDEIRAQNDQLAAALARTQPRAGGEAQITRAPLDLAFDQLAESFDAQYGGFHGAPKFPHAETLEFLLRFHAAQPAGERGKRALEVATLTLRRMAEGGIYDQVGGGFARYSVDAQWAIPHFEKMLYDNAWLLRIYAGAWAVTRDPLFARVCEETAAWVMREMQSPEGGYWSSLDADSEGEEGKFYVWTVDEIRSILSGEEFEVASFVYGLDRAPNFEGKAWHLTVANPAFALERGASLNEGQAQVLLDSARRKLRAAREKRVRPGLDDKVLTSWNALMIAGMAHAARVFGQPEWLASARRALDHIRRAMWRDGRLLATARDGHAHLDAYLDDHAYLLAALIEIMQAQFRAEDLAWATELGDALMDRFHDPREGGFFFTAHDHEPLILRPKPGPDNATPSGNAVAAWALGRLAFLSGDMRFAQAARGTIGLFWPQIERIPSAFGTMLAALEEQLTPARTLIVTGTRGQFGPWRELLDPAYLPAATVLFIPSETTGLPPPLAKPPTEAVNAWLCEGVTCLSPINSLERLREALGLAKIAVSTQAPLPHRSLS
ncbi:MAG TPA: thioredoxin domain-containing protein [Usitatibacter sp.]|nr:thioredoxin domain-containing protein [Usitatibacter sp.]